MSYLMVSCNSGCNTQQVVISVVVELSCVQYVDLKQSCHLHRRRNLGFVELAKGRVGAK